MNHSQAAAMLNELASQVPSSQVPVAAITAKRRKRASRGRLALGVVALVVMSLMVSPLAVILFEKVNQPMNTLSGSEGGATRDGQQMVHRGALALPIPDGFSVFESSACDGGGVDNQRDIIVVTASSIEDCVHSGSRHTRIYLTGLSNRPFGENWEEVTDPAGLIDGVTIRKLSSRSALVLSNSTYVTALVAPTEDFVLVIAGATPAQADTIMRSVRALTD